MTLTEQAKAELYRKLEGTLGKRIERIFERATLGEVEWDHDLWSGILDWIEGPLRRTLLYGPNVAPEARGEHNTAYKSYEAFDRLRLQGTLDQGYMMKVLFAAVREMEDIESDALRFLKVRFEEADGA